MRISNFTWEKKNPSSINVRISDGDYSRGTNALRGYVVGSSSCTPLQLDRQYFYACFAANILGSAESFPQALRETLPLKNNTKIKHHSKGMVFQKPCLWNLWSYTTWKAREAVSYDRPVRYIHISTTLRVPSSRSLLPVTGLELVLMVWLHAKWTSLNVSSRVLNAGTAQLVYTGPDASSLENETNPTVLQCCMEDVIHPCRAHSFHSHDFAP